MEQQFQMAQGVITISDNDVAPTVCIDAATSVNEGAGNATISISIDAVSGLDVDVNCATSNGTAGASDFTSTSGTATITAGNTSVDITVPITNDTDDELNETFTVALSSPVNATIGGGCSNTTTIVDNDVPPAICQNISVNLDASGNVSITESAVDNGSNVNGTVVSYDTDITAFTCSDLGAVSVVLTVTDNNGDTNTCNATVTVQDAIDPTISCVANQAQDTDAGVCTAVVNAIAPTATGDNCSIASVTYAITGATSATGNTDASGTTFNLGTSTVTYTITDGSGNTAQCSFDVVIS